MHIFAPALPELMQQAQVARDPGPSSQGQLGAHAAFTREIGSGRIGSLVIRSKARRAARKALAGRPGAQPHLRMCQLTGLQRHCPETGRMPESPVGPIPDI
jgi:hypothetical protein